MTGALDAARSRWHERQDTFSAELSAWLDAEAQVQCPANALDPALKATAARRPRPSVVAGPASHWIKAGPVNPMPLAVRGPLTSSRLVLLALVALLAVALTWRPILVRGRAEHGPAPQADRRGPAGSRTRPRCRCGEWHEARMQPDIGRCGGRADRLARHHVDPDVVHKPGHWTFALAAPPPEAETLDATQTLISYGLVFETTGDGRADYVVGISNDAPVRGDFRVWVTDLASGETREQVDLRMDIR